MSPAEKNCLRVLFKDLIFYNNWIRKCKASKRNKIKRKQQEQQQQKNLFINKNIIVTPAFHKLVFLFLYL